MSGRSRVMKRTPDFNKAAACIKTQMRHKASQVLTRGGLHFAAGPNGGPQRTFRFDAQIFDAGKVEFARRVCQLEGTSLCHKKIGLTYNDSVERLTKLAVETKHRFTSFDDDLFRRFSDDDT